jgi:hypothetical protein
LVVQCVDVPFLQVFTCVEDTSMKIWCCNELWGRPEEEQVDLRAGDIILLACAVNHPLTGSPKPELLRAVVTHVPADWRVFRIEDGLPEAFYAVQEFRVEDILYITSAVEVTILYENRAMPAFINGTFMGHHKDLKILCAPDYRSTGDNWDYELNIVIIPEPKSIEGMLCCL